MEKVKERTRFIKKDSVNIVDKEYNVKMFFEDIVPKEDISEYIFTIEMDKYDSPREEDLMILKNKMEDMFNSLEFKKLEYIPVESEIVCNDDGCLDVFYEFEYMNEKFDSGYLTDDNCIGKEIFRISSICESKTKISIEISFKSFLVINDENVAMSIWNIKEGVVTEFFIEELSRMLKK